MANKQDQILDKVSKINIKIAKIEEHLKAMNGAMVNHQRRLDGHDLEIRNLQKTIWKFGGGMAVLFILIQFIITKIL